LRKGRNTTTEQREKNEITAYQLPHAGPAERGPDEFMWSSVPAPPPRSRIWRMRLDNGAEALARSRKDEWPPEIARTTLTPLLINPLASHRSRGFNTHTVRLLGSVLSPSKT
jgi:hypothetical protein